MFQDQDGEREILLGNKQLLGIFFVLAVLFAVFFTAGYMVGRNGIEKKPVAASSSAGSSSSAPADDSAGIGETHAVAAENGGSAGAEPRAVSDQKLLERLLVRMKRHRVVRALNPSTRIVSLPLLAGSAQKTRKPRQLVLKWGRAGPLFRKPAKLISRWPQSAGPKLKP